jgi:hypothetical protein
MIFQIFLYGESMVKFMLSKSSPAESMKNEQIPTTLSGRLAWLLRYRGTTAYAVSRAAGLGNTNVYDIINEHSKNPRLDTLVAIVKVLDSRVDFLNGETDDPEASTPQTSIAVAIPITGVVQAGTYRSAAVAATHKISEVTMFVPKSTRFPAARHFIRVIDDEQMTALQPYPLTRGMKAVLVDFHESGGKIETGRVYYLTRAIKIENDVVLHDHGLWLATVIGDDVEFSAVSADSQVNAEMHFTMPINELEAATQNSAVYIEGLLIDAISPYQDVLASKRK